MEKIKVQNRELELYSDIKELPIARYHAFQRMCLLDAGIGSDLSAVDNHLGRIKAFLVSDEKEKALIEIENLRTNFWFLQTGISPALMAFAVLVYKLDGKIKGDLTDDGIKKTCEEISFLSAGQGERTTSEIKKKIETDLARYFPAFFDTADKKIIADLIRKKTLLRCKQLQGEEVCKELSEIEKKILTFSAPESFTGNDNAEIRFEKDFEKLCVYLSQELNADVSHKTVFEFFAAYEFVKKQKDTEKKQLQKWK